jgi:diguanylate cyclase (GGDEF)-like protein
VRRSARLAWLVTAPLVVLTAVTGWVAASAEGHFSPWYWTALLFAGFVAAEREIFTIEARRHGIRVSAVEIPLLLGLAYLHPLSVLTARIGAAVVTQVMRRSDFVKAVFNVAAMAAASSFAVLFVASAGERDVTSPITWIVLLGSIFVANVVMAVSTIAVISLVQGTPPRQLAQSAIVGFVTSLVNGIAGLIVLLVYQAGPWSLLLLGAVGVIIVSIYRGYAQFLRQHRSLSEINELTRIIAEHPYDGTFADVLLPRLGKLMNTEYATLWLSPQGRYRESLLSARIDDKGLVDLAATPASLRARAVATNTTVISGPKFGDDAMRTALTEIGTKDVIVIPLRSGGTVIGTLEVAGRMGHVTSLTEDDARLLETIAAHVSVAVENGRLVDRLRFDANHDTLTSLPNRRRVLAALEDALKVRAPGEVVAVFIFDIHGLRDVNDSLGHAAGDQLLVEFADRLRATSPAAALVGRLGGDKFAVTIRSESADASVALAREIREAMKRPMQFGSLSLDLDSAVGVSLHPEHGSDPAALLQQADVATHVAKTVPQGVQVFHPSLESRSVRRLGLAGDLRRALDEGALELHFQPKVALASREVVGVECLARWPHPVHGLVLPEDFLAVAEHTGQLGRLTEFILRATLRHARDWSFAGRPMPVSVNIPPRAMVDPELPSLVETLLHEYSTPPELLTLEISEDSGPDAADRQLPVLHRLDALGVGLSVDDFGAGSSSLAYLRRLPVDEVKIDSSFVQGMATSSADLAIVRAVVDLARHFRLRVVAEGVESERTLSLLAEMGCDVGQGFLFSRPLPYDRLDAWLSAQTDSEPTAGGEVRRLRAVT